MSGFLITAFAVQVPATSLQLLFLRVRGTVTIIAVVILNVDNYLYSRNDEEWLNNLHGDKYTEERPCGWSGHS